MDELGDLIWNLVDRSAGNAERHHVAALLHRHQPLSARDEDRQCFANAYRRTMAGNLLFLEATRDVLAQLHDNEISAIPLKGSFFALRFYGNLGVRPQNDVDILVKKKDREQAHDALIRADWREAIPRAYYEGHYHWVYERQDVLLELHWALKPPGTCSPSLDRLWKEAARTSREGMTFLDMSSEDALSHMATNKGHQHFSSLIDFVDIAMILQSRTVDWEKFIAQSLADNTEGPAWFALSCCMELFGSDVPPFVLETLFRSPGAWPAALLRGLLRIWGQPHRAPRALTRGPMGRIYETLLEGHPSFAFNLLRPLLFPPRAKLHVLSKGSLPRYYLNQLRKLKSH